MKDIKISAIVIARNEEKHLAKCLETLGWVDEIVVIDNDSTDKTAHIARKSKAQVFKFKAIAENGNFSKIREFGKSKAQGKWLLFVDADERVSSELKKEILDVVGSDFSHYSGYAIPRQNILLGHTMRFGGWWPDYVLRLIKKDKLQGYQGQVHEQPIIEGRVGKLKNPFKHLTHESLTEMVEKTNHWSEIEARLMFEAKHPKMNVFRFGTAVLREFWYRAILKLGFLDGIIGIIEIIYQMFSRFVSYAKLWELQIKNESRNS